MKTFKCLGTAIALGVATSASAVDVNLLLNGDMEASDTDWNTSDAAVDIFNDAGNGNGGSDHYLRTDAAALLSDGGSASGSQSVDVTDCSPYGLGEWLADGAFNTLDSTDTGDQTVSFDEGPSSSISNLNNNGWAAIGPDMGNIPDGATTATVTLTGSDDGTDGDQDAQVQFDDMHFGVNCVLNTAKVSGKLNTGSGKGNGHGRSYHTLSGAVAGLEEQSLFGDDELVGTLVINYRDPSGPSTCTFTPTDIDYAGNGTDGVSIDATYECEGGFMADASGNAVILMTDRDEQPPRGSINVDADDDELDISDSDGNSDTEAKLDKGNVRIDDGA